MKQNFKIDVDPRRNLRDWLEENFAYFTNKRCAGNLEEITEYSDIIFSAVSEVLNWTKTHSGESIVKYYKEDLSNITTAYNERNYKNFAESVRTLKDAIDVE
ncbi:MAG: hypothetical protein KJ583_02285 [Nanoarchaeota archaeon]|nr:hypothetical protein [Nanoarchaeota archaeon]MBU1269745.1 hypothetical protein [Nanoarchaeota archaeon]MBU1604123.1 hypothetical protein [Nanoarchaeota archaeon]MBU2443916.1 hypothetical protein [Nanoarchaeota archaeon]